MGKVWESLMWHRNKKIRVDVEYFFIFPSFSLYSQDAIERYTYLNVSRTYNDGGKVWCTNSLFSVKFYLQVLSMLMQRIDEGSLISFIFQSAFEVQRN